MLLAAALALAPSALGTYVSKIGMVGAGGMRTSLSLVATGEFSYSSRGCFKNETRMGLFRQRGDVVELTEVEAQGTNRSMPKRLFRLVQHGGDLYLLDDRELRAITRGEATYDMSLKRQSEAVSPSLSAPPTVEDPS